MPCRVFGELLLLVSKQHAHTRSIVGSNSGKANIWPQANHILWHGKCGVLSDNPDVAMHSKAHSKTHPDPIADGDVGKWTSDNVTHQAVLCLEDLRHAHACSALTASVEYEQVHMPVSI